MFLYKLVLQKLTIKNPLVRTSFEKGLLGTNPLNAGKFLVKNEDNSIHRGMELNVVKPSWKNLLLNKPRRHPNKDMVRNYIKSRSEPLRRLFVD
jgi:hypothetical protein